MERMLELSSQGYYCAQILLILALEAEGKEDPDLIRTVGGLNGGLGNSGNICGCLTGGACFLSYFLGKGEEDELPHPKADSMIQEFCCWFQEYTEEFGGTQCKTILNGDNRNKIQRCPMLLEESLKTCMAILEAHDCL